ncbi:hypothetical protein PARPLA_01336 [Rhodobacteraceae bacterium THAF1]|uniref:YdcF family protein n=1 Tax=Palleronia sp. THAF1 TaxID=2587842 RepID=UPI000F3F30E5|nr:YdcF family protein [Palleronia sp. THAF1]QFU09482.1 hypothetical protein FIU81_12420 [Palleronia sp. THAF1]VDC21839.1 hypothetical protein PARPLA_01336 [Rhodobacteraceae bacterium THAF1]
MGAAVWPGGVPSPTLERRCDAAASLFLAGGFDAVIPSGGVGIHGPAEAQVMRDLLISRGVPVDAIRLEDRATTTMETAINVAVMLAPDAGITVVSDTYHLLRCWLAFKGCGMSVRLRSARHGHPTPRTRIALKAWAREAAALPYYAWRIWVRR